MSDTATEIAEALAEIGNPIDRDDEHVDEETGEVTPAAPERPKFFKTIPRAWRTWMPHYATLLPMLILDEMRHHDISPSEKTEYIISALKFHDKINEERSRSVHGKLLRVEDVEVGNIGWKVRLVIESKGGAYTKDGEEDSFLTPWVEHNDPEAHVWELALGKDIERAATRLVGQEVSIRKAVDDLPAGSKGKTAKWAAGIERWVSRGEN